jgi:hypothetical protein
MVLGGKAGDSNNLPNYDEDSGDKPAGTGTVPAGPGIGGAGAAGTSAPVPAPARQ